MSIRELAALAGRKTMSATRSIGDARGEASAPESL
jgi:hypothetical protein